ncbi:hypothetical protein BpHYR1_010893 [Brachionus plicatilis]|uniref:Uncharacterized protein n=1 Tax=Brachionus plicatilis TaxID=10195 RepID=A0A3M7QWD9_BRAPC|nr:hypothetical protein BpHYR1_010893 [Brachionus plicatilis]
MCDRICVAGNCDQRFGRHRIGAFSGRAIRLYALGSAYPRLWTSPCHEIDVCLTIELEVVDDWLAKCFHSLMANILKSKFGSAFRHTWLLFLHGDTLNMSNSLLLEVLVSGLLFLANGGEYGLELVVVIVAKVVNVVVIRPAAGQRAVGVLGHFVT